MAAEPHTDDFIEILYKYTDFSGAQNILSNRTLRFARASEMNDPFDVYIADLFGMDLDEFFEESRNAGLEALLSSPERVAALTDADVTKIHEHSERLRTVSAEERARRQERLHALVKADPQHQEMQTALERQRDEFAERFRKQGIFCATSTYSNLLMWAHYADKHQGVVLGFLPDLEKDSFLRLIRPVRYSPERPNLLEPPQQQIAAGLPPTPFDAGKQINERVLYTKSTEWSYEQELRLTFPEEIRDGETATFNRFYANELVEIYLGYRITDDNKAGIIRLAKALNPDVRVFKARLAKRKYALEFDPVSVRD